MHAHTHTHAHRRVRYSNAAQVTGCCKALLPTEQLLATQTSLHLAPQWLRQKSGTRRRSLSVTTYSVSTAALSELDSDTRGNANKVRSTEGRHAALASDGTFLYVSLG